MINSKAEYYSYKFEHNVNLKREKKKKWKPPKEKGGQKKKLVEERGFLPIDDKIFCFLSG